MKWGEWVCFEWASPISATMGADALEPTEQQKATIAEIRQEYGWSMRRRHSGPIGICLWLRIHSVSDSKDTALEKVRNDNDEVKSFWSSCFSVGDFGS